MVRNFSLRENSEDSLIYRRFKNYYTNSEFIDQLCSCEYCNTCGCCKKIILDFLFFLRKRIRNKMNIIKTEMGCEYRDYYINDYLYVLK